MLTRKRFGALVSLFAIVAVLSGVAALDAGQWPMYRGPDHTGISKETGWFDAAAGVKVVWEKKVGKGFASIAVGGGRAFTVGNADKKDTVYCFDAKTGKKIWSFSYDAELYVPKEFKGAQGGPNATPTIDGDNVYTVSKLGAVRCFSADKGQVKWTSQIKSKHHKWGFSASPLVVGDLLVLNAGSAGTALNKTTGKTVWSSGPGFGGYATPVPLEYKGKQHVLLLSYKSAVLVAIADGKKAWSFAWETKHDINAPDPIIVGENVFISTGFGTGCCLVPLGKPDAKPIWKNKNMKSWLSGCVMLDGHVYGFDKNKLTCLDLKTGEAKWSESSLGMGALILSDGKLIVMSEKGKLVIAKASPDGYKELSSGVALKNSKRCWSPPAIADGLIYLRNGVGDLVCVKVGK